MSKKNSHTVDFVILIAVVAYFYASQNPLPNAQAAIEGKPTGKQKLQVPVPGAKITSPFGFRVDPVTGKHQIHAGQDYEVPVGTPIHAAAAGTVTKVTPSALSGGYGNYTCIDHGGGLSTCYAHQSAFKVSKGEYVERGQIIGLSGSTGASTGPHLHFEVRVNGKVVNPNKYL